MHCGLKRIVNRVDGTFGVILLNTLPIAVCLERPWLDNRRGESCIPTGSYTAKRILSPKFGDTFEITNVPDRQHILFHKGNILEDSHGCIILGEYYNIWSTGKCSVASSGDAFTEFMKRLKDVDEFTVSITNCYT